mmetsp:Transcript_5547/g.9933  ORF Transcript_5547/g.9933 Transcript_5547/m.9933 type:complete len:93 (+) Transcript_5547:944-1222(+)
MRISDPRFVAHAKKCIVGNVFQEEVVATNRITTVAGVYVLLVRVARYMQHVKVAMILFAMTAFGLVTVAMRHDAKIALSIDAKAPTARKRIV